jgi:hypothetical protein
MSVCDFTEKSFLKPRASELESKRTNNEGKQKDKASK